MEIIAVSKPKERIKCVNLRCNEELGPFDLKKGRRFCVRCRNLPSVLLWKCENPKCAEIISGCVCRETRRFCKKCSGYKQE